jgi:hypothetical protein
MHRVKVNDVGDVVLEDVRRGGRVPVQLAGQSRHVSRAVPALEQLAEAGLVEAPDGTWRAPGRGLFRVLAYFLPGADR